MGMVVDTYKTQVPVFLSVLKRSFEIELYSPENTDHIGILSGLALEKPEPRVFRGKIHLENLIRKAH